MFQIFSRLLSAKSKTDCSTCPPAPMHDLHSNTTQKKYTLFNAAVDTVKGDFATSEERERRLAICRTCEYLDKGDGKIIRAERCKLCGCFVHIKAGYTNASCDINKW